MKKLYIAILVVVVLIAGAFYHSYYHLNKMNDAINTKLSQIQTTLHNKAELVPALTDSVKEHASHEEAAFAKIAEARAKLAEAKGIAELNAANQELDAATDRLLNLAETYPELKADETYNAVKRELDKTNEMLEADRMDYNAYVQKFNTRIKSMPDSIFAGPLGYYNKEYFKEVAGQENLPEINY